VWVGGWVVGGGGGGIAGPAELLNK
jgi:hypothetical protein